MEIHQSLMMYIHHLSKMHSQIPRRGVRKIFLFTLCFWILLNISVKVFSMLAFIIYQAILSSFLLRGLESYKKTHVS